MANRKITSQNNDDRDALAEDNMPQSEGEELDAKERRAVFARIFAKHNRWLYAYLVSLLGSPASAEEVFQEVCVVLWKEYERFDPNTNFMKWASVIAHNQVRQFRRANERFANRLSDEAVDLLAQEGVEYGEVMEAQRLALPECLKRLSESDRELVQNCYSDTQQSMKSVAEQLGRPVNTVYKAMQRIRRDLRDCIQRKLTTEGLL